VSRPPVRNNNLSIFQPDFSKYQAKFCCQTIMVKKNFHFSDVFSLNAATKLLAV